MKTERKLAITLKMMMAEKPLDDISVMAICKRCKVNRQTFYYHFHDIYDLLTSLFLEERIDGADTVKSYYEMIKCIYEYYDKNRKFVEATISSAGKDLFLEFIYNVCYQSTLRIMDQYEVSKNVALNYKKNVARFYASAFSNSIVYYLQNYKERTLEGLLNCFNFVEDHNLLSIMQKLANK